jgi:hypothetical protein
LPVQSGSRSKETGANSPFGVRRSAEDQQTGSLQTSHAAPLRRRTVNAKRQTPTGEISLQGKHCMDFKKADIDRLC